VINFVNIKEEDKLSRVAKVAMTQGMWGFEESYSSTYSDYQIDKVDGAADAQKRGELLGLVMKYPVDTEGEESDEHNTISAGDRVIFVNAPGVEVEDDKLATNNGDTTWSTVTFLTPLVVNTSGYLTPYDADDAPASAVYVAEFLRYVNGIVFYRTILSASTAAAS